MAKQLPQPTPSFLITSFDDEEDTFLKCTVRGAEFTGKTRLLMTMPKPLFILTGDSKTVSTVKAYMDLHDLTLGEDVYLTHVMTKSNILPSLAKDIEQLKISSSENLNKFEQALEWAIFNPSINSIGVDTLTFWVELAILAYFGRAEDNLPIRRRPMNSRIAFLMDALKLCDKHVMLSEREGEVWETNEKGVMAPNGKTKSRTWKDVGYYVSTQLRLHSTKRNDKPYYLCDFVNCQARPGLMGALGKSSKTGLENNSINFYNIMRVISGMKAENGDSEEVEE